MIYLNMNGLAEAALQMDVTDAAQVAKWRSLLKIYVDALNSPPAGVIGVGAITHAENQLVAAQLDLAGLCEMSLDILSVGLAEFCAKNDLPHISADELVAGNGLTPEQRDWLNDFIAAWELVS